MKTAQQVAQQLNYDLTFEQWWQQVAGAADQQQKQLLQQQYPQYAQARQAFMRQWLEAAGQD